MKILVLNQAFYPDIVSSGQHAADLALRLKHTGHDVTVMTSRRGYDDWRQIFSRREVWKGIRIVRISTLGLGKTARWRRVLEFGSFSMMCLLRLIVWPRFDLVIALTSPPLISALAALFVRLKGGKFVFWVMDLNPDEAIAAGYIAANSWASRVLKTMLLFSLKSSHRVIALDRFMARRLAGKGVPAEKIAIIPPWSHDGSVFYDSVGRQVFRTEHDLTDKFVVMYSGNHSPCHPLDTLLEAVRGLAYRADIAFCFVGGGSEFRKVQAFAELNRLANIRCIPYQPLERLSASLSAADLHVVVMGDPFVGIVHPCKVYNILALGIPFMYIGPTPSHVTQVEPAASLRHGDVDGVRKFVIDSRRFQGPGRVEEPGRPPEMRYVSQESMLAKMVRTIESVLQKSPGDASESSLLKESTS